MCEVMDRKEQGWLYQEDVQKFPYQDLRVIDQLWVKYSHDRFGFSVQKKIYVECGAKLGKYPGTEIWKRFGDLIGWRQNGDWLRFSDLNPSLSSSRGNFPVLRGGAFSYILERVDGWIYCLFSRTDL